MCDELREAMNGDEFFILMHRIIARSNACSLLWSPTHAKSCYERRCDCANRARDVLEEEDTTKKELYEFIMMHIPEPEEPLPPETLIEEYTPTGRVWKMT